MSVLKKVFYPYNECKTIIFQTTIMLLLIGCILFIDGFINGFVNAKYDYLSDNSLFERIDEHYYHNELGQAYEKLNSNINKYEKIFNLEITGEEVIVDTLKISNDGLIANYNVYFCNNVEEVYQYTSNEKFNCTTINDKGLYVSSYFCSHNNVDLGDWVDVEVSNTSFKMKIVGKFNTQNHDVQNRIYSNEYVFDKVKFDDDFYYFSVYYLYFSNSSFDCKKIQNINNQNYDLKSKQFLIAEEMETFTNIIKIVNVYAFVSVFILGIVLFVLFFIKNKASTDTNFIYKIFYKKNIKIFIFNILNDLIMFIISFIASFILLIILAEILNVIFKVNLTIDFKFYIFSLIEFIFAIFSSIISYFIFKDAKFKV